MHLWWIQLIALQDHCLHLLSSQDPNTSRALLCRDDSQIFIKQRDTNKPLGFFFLHYPYLNPPPFLLNWRKHLDSCQIPFSICPGSHPVSPSQSPYFCNYYFPSLQHYWFLPLCWLLPSRTQAHLKISHQKKVCFYPTFPPTAISLSCLLPLHSS